MTSEAKDHQWQLKKGIEKKINAALSAMEAQVVQINEHEEATVRVRALPLFIHAARYARMPEDPLEIGCLGLDMAENSVTLVRFKLLEPQATGDVR